MENVRKWATIAEGAIDTNTTNDITAMVTDIQTKLTMTSVTPWNQDHHNNTDCNHRRPESLSITEIATDVAYT